MRRWAWSVAVVVLLSSSAYSGYRAGDAPLGAQATGTSSSGSGQSGGSGSGQSGGGGGGDGGDDGGGGGGGESPGSSAPSGGGGGGGGGSGTDDGGGGGGGGGGGSDDDITAPRSSSSVPRERVAEGRPTDCPEGTDANRRCFTVEDAADAVAAAVPDGKGGTVVVAVPDGQLAGDGFSTSAASNPEVHIEVDARTGTIVEAEEQGGIRQAVWLTLAGLALLLVGVYVGAKMRRPRQDPQ